MIRSSPMSDMTLSPETSALLIVDVQEKLARAIPAPLLKRAVRHMTWLLEAARRMEVPVFVTEQYAKGLGPTIPELRAQLDLFPAPPPVVDKLEFDACAAAGFAESLQQLAPGRSVVVTGMESHICVYQTTRGLVGHGATVHVPFDATCSRSADTMRIAEGLWAGSGAVVTCTETVLFDWMHKSGGETFKAISRLLKDAATSG